MRRFSFIWGLIIAICWGCGDTTQVHPAFYHWKTEFSPGPAALDALDQLEVERLYLRIFDVDIAPGGGPPRPIARLKAQLPYPEGVEIVPCMFITNRTFKGLLLDQVPDLAERVYQLIQDTQSTSSLPSPQEVQIDCDWTPSTQEKYFLFLDELKAHLVPDQCALSSTIRLHQYKYPEQTGVPKVDRGMLMVYNVGNLDDPNEENSIYDLETVRSYIEPVTDYPLELDVALPIFGWGVLIRRGKPIRLLNNLHLSHTQEDSLLKQISSHRVEVLQSHYFRGTYLYAQDEIRLESVSSKALLAGAELIAAHLPPAPNRHIALYHLDTQPLENYALDTLQAVFRSFN